MTKNVDVSYYYLRRSHSVPSQDITADDPPNRCFECSKPSSAAGSPDFLEDSWQTNGCVPLIIDDCDMSEKTGDNMLGCASCASNFCWILLILKHLYSRLLFNFALIRANPRFITYHDVIAFGAFHWTSRHESFLNNWQIVWDGQMFMQYWMLSGPTKA